MMCYCGCAVKLHDRFYDKEERVRMEVVKTVCEVAAENFDAIPKAVSMFRVVWRHVDVTLCIFSCVMTSKEG